MRFPLNFLFPSRRDMVKRCIKAALNQEKEDISGGQIKKPYTDQELNRRISESYGLLTTRREIAYCRKELGILPYFERNGYVYHTLAANFSQIYRQTVRPSDRQTGPTAMRGNCQARVGGIWWASLSLKNSIT